MKKPASIYDATTHCCHFPVSGGTWQEPEVIAATVLQLRQLGVLDLREVALPIPLPFRLYRGKMPAWLQVAEVEEEVVPGMQELVFLDERQRRRLQIVVNALLVRTWVVTRYEPLSLLGKLRFQPAVRDWQADQEYCWRGQGRRGDTQQEAEQRAQQWLNRHYPEWRDPLAYWED